MSIKKKMSTGILAGALGLSLIGGGTWAAFNDVEAIDNSFAAGTLDLLVGQPTELAFNISNLKPGDYFTKKLVLTNGGSLPINDILFHANKVTTTTFVDKNELGLSGTLGQNTEDDFLSQFSIVITKENQTAPVYSGNLLNLVSGTGVGELTGTRDSTGAASVIGLDKTASQTYNVKVTFEQDSTLISGTRLHAQNKFQGEGTDLQFVFEATQMPGENRSNN